MIIDFWHPDFSNAEVKFFTLLYNSKLKYLHNLLRIEKMISEYDPDKDNFYSIIEESKNIL